MTVPAMRTFKTGSETALTNTLRGSLVAGTTRALFRTPLASWEPLAKGVADLRLALSFVA